MTYSIDNVSKKTEPYALACSNTCLQRLREEVNATDCKKEADMKNIGRLVGKECRGDACQQELTNFVSKQFCAYQNQYHNIVPWEITYRHEIYIPELEKSTCTEQCQTHLENALTYNDWESWCLDYASGNILGFCSTTDCNCDEGYDGLQCELKCPMGSADGEDATVQVQMVSAFLKIYQMSSKTEQINKKQGNTTIRESLITHHGY